MRSISIAIVLTLSIASSHGQGAAREHDAAISPGVTRIKALQNQINRQQSEINSLMTRMDKLQDAFQELADTIADESTDTDEDDFSNDSVAGFVVNSPSNRTKRDAGRIRRSATPICSNPTVSCPGCRASLKKSTTQ